MNYFPTYLALGDAFCNRKEELKRIHYHLKGNTPILLISPRRYGKTSLALKSFALIKWPYAHIDLFKALSSNDIEQYILQGIGQLLGKLENTPGKLLRLASDYFSSMQIKVILEKTGIKLEFDKIQSTSSNLIFQALERLHAIALKKNKRIILFLDEFQVVGEVSQDHALEAVIRELAQKSSHIAFVFSGSNRHLMEQMFYDRKRPFYKLCEQIRLERIAAKEYDKYINAAAQVCWNDMLASETLQAIFAATELHPYYVNKLCSLLWLAKNKPNEKDVREAWQQIVFENKSIIARELDLLSLNQRKILIYLASHQVNELFSKKVSQELNMTPSSIQRAMQPLLEKDYIFMNQNNFYQILDPLIKSVLAA